MKKTSPRYTFQQFNNEVNELYNYLKSEKYKDEEIQKIFSPLISKMKRSNKGTCLVISIMTFCFLIYLLTYIDSMYWHITAIGRIGLIKILPYFDWRYLKSKRCLIEKFGTVESKPLLNCDVCEGIRTIHVYDKINEDILIQHYLELDVPLILTTGLETWPQDPSFIDDVIKDDVFYFSYPCKLSTNIHKGSSYTGELLEKAQQFDSFFLHFQNCELEAMKVFRRYTYRPNFLPPVYSPVLYNWLFWNKEYNATNYKPIDLVERVGIFSQIIGNTYVRLTPRLNCKDVCSVLDFVLHKGESLVFTNLWDVEYKSSAVGENMAVILETKN